MTCFAAKHIDAARFETARGRVEIRELATIAEMTAAEKVQQQVWGLEAIPTPKETLIPVQHEGGLLGGAFAIHGAAMHGPTADGGEMVGLIFGFPTRDPAAMHSHILGTLADWRGLGIGARLKWFQRDWCLARGITLVRWTVDPLRAANAHLNIHHLGATASTYLPDYYGPMQGIDAGAPTDRLLVQWRLDSPRVAALSAHTPPDQGFPDAKPANLVSEGRPTSSRLDRTSSRLLIYLPADFLHLAQTDPTLALDWRLRTRELFLHYFAHGYTITGFTRVPLPAYQLERKD
jgi:chorismate synthase